MDKLINKFIKKIPNIFTQQGLAIILGLLGTGIGAYGGMPSPPLTFSKTVDKYPVLQWILVWVLIWQGAGGFDEILSLYGTIIIFIIYYMIKFLEKNYDLLYHLGLNEKTRSQIKKEKKMKENEDLETEKYDKSIYGSMKKSKDMEKQEIEKIQNFY